MPVSVAFRIFVLIVIIIAFFMILPVIKNLRQNATAAETEQGTENREQGTDSNNKEQVAGSKERDKREEITGNKEQITEGKKPQTEKPAVTEQQEKKPVASEQPNNKPQTEKPARQPSLLRRLPLFLHRLSNLSKPVEASILYRNQTRCW